MEIRKRRNLKPPIIWSLRGNNSKHYSNSLYVNVYGGGYVSLCLLHNMQAWFCI